MITIVLAPPIHGATVDWALGYMEDNYGSWMVGIGWYAWCFLVAAITFLSFNLLFAMTLKFMQFAIPFIMSRFI